LEICKMSNKHIPTPGPHIPSARISAFLLVVVLAFLLTACGDMMNDVPATPAEQQPEPTDEPQAAEPTSAPVAETEPSATSAPVVDIEATSTPTAAPTTAPSAGAAIGSEILFLRGGMLMAYDIDGGQERPIAADVHEFAATPDGRTLALVRGAETQPRNIWLIERDGTNLRQITNDDRSEGSLAWAPDGQTLAYASATTSLPPQVEQNDWMQWCASSDVRLMDTTSQNVTSLGSGCSPAISHDGRRVAFATPPQNMEQGTNTIRLVNRQGENGWSFASADATEEGEGLLVYGPAWTPDDAEIAYHRFIGYRALTDLNYIEMGGSFQGDGDLMHVGMGWLLPPRFAPNNQRMAFVEFNFSDARGWGGYERWAVKVLQPGQQSEIPLPSGMQQVGATMIGQLSRATAAAWAPDGQALVVALPPDWSSDAPTTEPQFPNAEPGELWRWVPGNAPAERLVENVDFASPVLWLPAL
jgi:dipeptidyl aminopeptidase/acylaminoacyl peptidase